LGNQVRSAIFRGRGTLAFEAVSTRAGQQIAKQASICKRAKWSEKTQ
jgi:hypothetical protein